MTRLVVVGNGMVGSRFVEDLAGRRRRRPLRLTVLGAEALRALQPRAAQRGRRRQARPLGPHAARRPRAPGSRCLRGDAGAATSTARTGSSRPATAPRLRYDLLVLATGSRAPGSRRWPGAAAPATGTCPPACTPCARSTTPARSSPPPSTPAAPSSSAAASSGWRRPAGSPAAGVAVTVVHPAAALMERQLDDEAGRVVELGDGAAWASTTGSASAPPEALVERRPRSRACASTTARWSPADLLVLATGTVPEHRPRGARRARGRPRHRRRTTTCARPTTPRLRHRRLRPAARGRHRPGRPGLGAVPPARRPPAAGAGDAGADRRAARRDAHRPARPAATSCGSRRTASTS